MGLFVSIEGNDGSGKTSIVAYLEKALKKQGIPVLASREPGGIRISEKIRDLILDPENTEMGYKTEALLYAASRSQHIEEKILPALKAGKIVLSDRFIDSSLAYQGYGRKLGVDEIYNLNLFAISGRLPDLTFFLEVDNEVAQRRVHSRKTLDRLELEASEFHQSVANGYKEICANYPKRIIKIDANRSLKTVGNEILNIILEHYVK